MKISASQKAAKFSHPWYAERGLLYFVAAGKPPIAVKIGITQRNGLIRRLRAIQGSNHEPIELLGVLLFETGNRPLFHAEQRERELHRQFGHLQRFEHGWVGSEWFDAAPDLLEFIAANATSPEKLGLSQPICRPTQRK